MQQPFIQRLTERLHADEIETLSPGEVLFRSGEAVSKVYVVRSGAVDLVRPLSHGDFLTVHRALPGSLLAEASLFASHYHCDAIAGKSSSLCSYPRSQARQLLFDEPAMAEQLCAGLTAEVQSLRTRLELCHIQSADERLLAWIRLNAAPDNGVLILDRTLKSIASELGLAHETLYRSLKRLEQAQVIRRESDRLILM